MINRLGKGVSLVLIAGLFACGGDAQNAADEAADTSQAATAENQDLATLSNYELTMDDLRKWAKANTAVARIAREKPELEQQMEMGAEDASIDALGSKLNSVPEVKNAIEANGLTTQRFAIITYTVMQIAMAQMALQQGVPADSFAVRAGINPKNLEFYEANRTEIDQLMQQLQSENNPQQ